MRAPIFIFTKLFWPEGGGAELATYLIVKNILSNVTDVVVVSGTCSPCNDVYRYAKYVCLPLLRDSSKLLDWFMILSRRELITRFIKLADVIYIPSHTLLPIAIIAKKINPDVRVVVHLHNFQPLTYTSVAYPHGRPGLRWDVFTELSESGSIVRAITVGLVRHLNMLSSISLSFADVIICVSRMQCEYIAKYVKGVENKIVVIYNPPPPVPRIEKKLYGEPVLVFPGGTCVGKGFYLILESLPRLIKFAKLYIIKGREHNPRLALGLKKLAKIASGKLIVLDRLPHEEYLRLYERAWSLLFPSTWVEPLPYSVIESILLRSIPIMSSCIGVTELIKGTELENFVVKPGDVEDIVSKVESLTSMSPKEVLDAASEAKSRLLNILSRSASSLMKLFESLLTR